MFTKSAPTKPRATQAVNPNSFWSLAHNLTSLTEDERLSRISAGFEVSWLVATRAAFNVTGPVLAHLANLSKSTVERRIKGQAALDPVASERIDRLAQVAVMAEGVFEDKALAAAWMTKVNDALGGKTPLSLCNTELGARQVRRVLHAIEWGGVA